ncbi:RluA family pseudouridine synthase [Halioxenophilus aromaticivorans]|uniref:Pseudouridine synthase n=1 Tax=Halioxenophilus aromaticivorans TaxID=1306992 RepID=A0AAV3U9Z8_9ALTE
MNPSDFDDYQIVYQDQDVLVVNKAPGLLTVPGRLPENKRSLATLITQCYPNSHIVHRLDQATSGLLVVPQSKNALSNLAKQFQGRTVGKRYQAVVTGILNSDQGEVTAPMMCDWPNRPRQIVHADGKPSRTRFRVLAKNTDSNSTRVVLHPETGRSHQLRVHMQHLGHPILGDNLYADAGDAERTPVLMLHAEQLTFRHPTSNTQMTFTAPPQHWPHLTGTTQ